MIAASIRARCGCSSERVLARVIAHQAVEAFAHVDGFERDVDLGGGAEAENMLLGLGDPDVDA